MSTLAISTFCDRFRRIGMRPRDWRIGLSHSPAIAQITLSSVKLCLSLKWGCLLLCFVSWDSTVPQCTCFSKHVSTLLKISFQAFYAFTPETEPRWCNTQNVTLAWCAVEGKTNNAAHDAVQVGPPVILKTVRMQLHAPQPGSLSWLI